MLVNRLLAVAVGLFFLGIVGCGPSLYQPPGKLTKGGAPLKMSEKAVLQLSLFADADSALAEPYSTTWEKDGTFKVVGRNGGIPAGKYKTSVVLIDPYPEGKDVFGGRYAKGKGPAVEVKNGQTEVVIDLEK